MDILTQNKKDSFWEDFAAGAIVGAVALTIVYGKFKSVKKEEVVKSIITISNELIKKNKVNIPDVLRAANVISKKQLLGGEFHYDKNEIVFLKPHCE